MANSSLNQLKKDSNKIEKTKTSSKVSGDIVNIDLFNSWKEKCIEFLEAQYGTEDQNYKNFITQCKSNRFEDFILGKKIIFCLSVPDNNEKNILENVKDTFLKHPVIVILAFMFISASISTGVTIGFYEKFRIKFLSDKLTDITEKSKILKSKLKEEYCKNKVVLRRTRIPLENSTNTDDGLCLIQYLQNGKFNIIRLSIDEAPPQDYKVKSGQRIIVGREKETYFIDVFNVTSADVELQISVKKKDDEFNKSM